MHGVKAPAKINFDAGVCDSQSTQYVGVFGEFGSRRLSSKKPVVKLVIDKENVPFKWTFHMGGVNGDSDTHSFTIGKFKSNYIKWTVHIGCVMVTFQALPQVCKVGFRHRECSNQVDLPYGRC